MITRIFILLFLILTFHQKGIAQIYGTNTLEIQYGNLPFQDKRFGTSYNQLNLFYDHNNLSFFGKVERFSTPDEDRNYFDLTQKRVQYSDDMFRVRLGNFYETLGRGLLLRSYDIPGSVYEEEFERTRYAFFRDLEGIAIDATTDLFEVKVLHAKPLFNILPPNFELDTLRRPDLIEAIQTNVFLDERLSFGGALMRSYPNTSDQFREYGSLMFSSTPVTNFSLFGEYAFETDARLFGFKDEDAYALYLGSNFYFDSFGGSIEYKDYNNFRLGQGYNDPPSLIKEHTYPVLNRSTHVLNVSNETGFQLEGYYNFEGGHSVTANYTTANNDGFVELKYREYFLEGFYKVDNFLSVKAFFDYAKDEPKGEEDRISIGFITDKSFDYEWGLNLDIQYQTFNRSFDPEPSSNYYAALSFSYLPDLSAGIVFEASSDPQLTDNPATVFEIEDDLRTWLGANFSYKFSSSNRLDVFAGKRRGGPACTSGICYEILDFEGVELRFSTRF
ncbi:MAG: hypothetical protein ACMZ7B_01400 [Balneola sp.]